jgi:hypothetical protein
MQQQQTAGVTEMLHDDDTAVQLYTLDILYFANL